MTSSSSSARISPVTTVSSGNTWQTEPVIRSLCDALRRDANITDLCDPNPEDIGWYTYFKLNGWTWYLYVQWDAGGHHKQCFEFDVRLCNTGGIERFIGRRMVLSYRLLESLSPMHSITQTKLNAHIRSARRIEFKEEPEVSKSANGMIGNGLVIAATGDP